VVSGAIPGYQAAAWLMAVYLKGMDFDELAALTRAMMESGEQFNLSSIPGVKVDKHSTGGVGDKVSLILAPLAASAGARVPMVAGRSLGHTGGTLDKLESIPGPPPSASGYNPHLNGEQFARQVEKIGCAIIGQADNFVPADKILYALRDVTGTVESIPLIAASICSKKFASGADAFVMDVKTGSGAFMQTEERARELAETMRQLGQRMGKRVVCLITDMNQPLGKWVGNAVEVRESVDVLKGTGDAALTRLCLLLGAWMLRLAGIEEDVEEAQRVLSKKIMSGEALRKFALMVEAQGGDPAIVSNPGLLKLAPRQEHFRAAQAGFVAACDARAVGVASMLLGGGRQEVKDDIDPSAGIQVRNRIGDRVARGEPLFTLYYNEEAKMKAAMEALERSVEIAPKPVEPPAMVKAIISGI